MSELTFSDAGDVRMIKRNDWQIIGLVGSAHACSHFFQLLLPTLFLSLSAEFGFDFVQLGFLTSVFFLVSCMGQASSGFVVDRIGPVPVLLFGLGCLIVAAVMIGLAPGYTVLLLAAALGGVGNSVFHPVDYSILNHRISKPRLGHAFSAHGLTGNLGWALSPVFISTLTLLFNWRVATICAGLLVAAVMAAVWLGRDLLSGQALGALRSEEGGVPEKPAKEPQAPVGVMLRTLMVQPSLWGAFLFFACTATAWSGVQQYTIPLFTGTYGMEKVLASAALSSYMVLSALGMLAGGFLVSASARNELVLAISLVLAGALLAVLAMGVVSNSTLAVLLLVLAGFASGVSTPSRDMLIRRVTPKGSTGSVYGLVYSGMDVGSSLGPIMFGAMVDHGLREGPWYGAGIAFALAAWLAIMVARFGAAKKTAAQGA